MDTSFSKGALIALYSMGIAIEDSIQQQNNEVIYISVPEHSYLNDSNGNEMSGNFLAKKFKKLFPNVILKSRIRKGEYWTKEMDEQTYLHFKNMI